MGPRGYAEYLLGKSNAKGFELPLSVFFQTVFEHLGELLTVLITLDEIMNECSGIHENWKRYKRYNCSGFPFGRKTSFLKSITMARGGGGGRERGHYHILTYTIFSLSLLSNLIFL